MTIEPGELLARANPVTREPIDAARLETMIRHAVAPGWWRVTLRSWQLRSAGAASAVMATVVALVMTLSTSPAPLPLAAGPMTSTSHASALPTVTATGHFGTSQLAVGGYVAAPSGTAAESPLAERFCARGPLAGSVAFREVNRHETLRVSLGGLPTALAASGAPATEIRWTTTATPGPVLASFDVSTSGTIVASSLVLSGYEPSTRARMLTITSEATTVATLSPCS